MTLKPHHAAWLSRHPHRSSEWLTNALRDGFDVHHLDGNAENNSPDNLLLIEASDHTQILHGLMLVRAIGCVPGRRKPSIGERKLERGRIAYEARRDHRWPWLECSGRAGCTPNQAERWAKAYALANNLPWPLAPAERHWPPHMDIYLRR